MQPSRIDAIEDWPWLDQEVLRTSRSHQVCMTCHFCCSSWMENLRRQRGREPEVE
jgi:hypothetical protein